MIHLGDITKISGFDVPTVDIITGGSPCQDLSVAGKRAGLAGERSGLFMEQIRIIKEMREKEIQSGKTNDTIRPRYMVWENVPGAFSSNKGEDFRAVLEETAKVADKDAVIPGLKGGQKWTPSGCILGDGWSIAWRLHDAQFWGVPQRRKRIALVADFGGSSAPEILFERKGLSRDIKTSGEERKGTAAEIERSPGATIGFNGWQSLTSTMPTLKEKTPPIEATMPPNVCCSSIVTYGFELGVAKRMNPENRFVENAVPTLRAADGGDFTPKAIAEVYDASRRHNYEPFGEVSETVQAHYGTGGNNTPMVVSTAWDGSQVSPTLTANNAGGNQRMPDKDNFNAVISFGNGQLHDAMSPSVEVSKTLNCVNDFAKIVTYGLDRASFNQGENAQFDFSIEEDRTAPIVARGPGAVCARDYKGAVVRRLTPLECERLQGFPDYWTDIGDWVDSKGKKHKGDSDSPRYKALGNSIALPFWKWMAKRMVKYLDIEHATYLHHPTMASLFDGIGGFPIAYSEAGCEPVWASEIEEFPIAVTKIRFGEN